ncbi:MAG: molybdopterin molybdotransferase MoeA [Deltaproteobacteria bacterium]|nr:molybdopterin molybdotransferase MoeA [Deltaproteobacteria bacterium]
MKTITEAQELVLSHVTASKAENVALLDSMGRVLAEDVQSNRNHPPYDISAMDGYAVKFSDIKGATKDKPAILKIVDDIKAGAEPKCSVEKGQASRIMTGAPVPKGIDTIVRVEDTDCNDTEVKIFTEWPRESNLRKMGENLKTGDTVLKAGTDIGPAEVGILAMVKKAEVKVHKKPRIAILSTGDELEALTEPFNERKIPDANSYTVLSQLRAAGADPELIGIAKDSPESLREHLKKALTYDGMVVSGGVSVGHHDFVRPTLTELGIDMLFWRVAIRPGHPFAFGVTKDNKPVFALPGNPVSSMVCAEEFIIPAVRRMTGAKKAFRRTVRARLTHEVKDKRGRTHFMRVKLEKTPNEYLATLTGSQGSGILMSMVEADGLMVMPKDADHLIKGCIVTVQLLNIYGADSFQEIPDINE